MSTFFVCFMIIHEHRVIHVIALNCFTTVCDCLMHTSNSNDRTDIYMASVVRNNEIELLGKVGSCKVV